MTAGNSHNNRSAKDRRMLVLFLCAVLLLSCDCLSLSRSFFPGLFFDDHSGSVRADRLFPADSGDIASKTWPGHDGAGRMSPQLCFFLGRPMAINRASLQDLVLLPGIGERLAARILAYRQEYGPIHSVAELAKIRGISKKLGRKISPMISFDSTGAAKSFHAD